MRPVFFVLILLVGFTATSAAQGGSCTSAVTVAVTDAKGEPIHDLSAQDFTIRAKGNVTVSSLAYDDGPRRIVLVVDQSKKHSPNTRRAANELTREMLAAARAQDSFALVVARGSGKVVRFGEDVKGIAEAVVSEDAGGQSKEIGVLDAVTQAIELFGAPQTGDSIVVIAADLEGNRKANPKSVAKALREHRIRLFGLAMGPVSQANIAAGSQSTTAWGLATVTPMTGLIGYSNGDQNFIPLTSESGGAVLPVINYQAKRTYDMSDPKLQEQVRKSARVVSAMVAAFYRLQLERPQAAHDGEEWKLELKETLRKNSPQLLVLYPHQFGPC
ncbi:MAG TPA: hypothetical protein VFL42_01505 [Terriglobales bacterium]|nr:hypothetical protein [Terriglobales bacterium]